MEIHQLEYVVAVDRYKHFSLAAEQINVSQPTLSHQIKKLEIELGVELFIRTTRSIQVTAAGKEFIQVRGVGGHDGVALYLVGHPAKAVQNAQAKRFLAHLFVSSLVNIILWG